MLHVLKPYSKTCLVTSLIRCCWLFQEGAAFLEKVGQVDEDAKTRAQQKKLDDAPETEKESEAKLERTTTMAATAKVMYGWKMIG